jgi:nifR3 family TIM-barrel protein
MKNPELIEEIVSAIKRAVSIPVTVKLRTGVNEKSINAVECALAAEAGGASMITLHGRTREQMYGGLADRKIIKDVKSRLHIPLIANGDVTNSESALAMLSETGADGIAIGRGAVGNPFLFSEIISAIEKTDFTEPTLRERTDAALFQLRCAVEEKGEYTAVTESRKQIALYLHAFRGAAALRAKINSATTYREVEHILLSALDAES